jgi:hypothetical protein
MYADDPPRGKCSEKDSNEMREIVLPGFAELK